MYFDIKQSSTSQMLFYSKFREPIKSGQSVGFGFGERIRPTIDFMFHSMSMCFMYSYTTPPAVERFNLPICPIEREWAKIPLWLALVAGRWRGK